MADVERTDAAVSSVQVDADSLEFTVNTNLPVASTSPPGASPSLQELIEAELNVRLCQPDSLEPPASPNPSSLLSCDSIEATTPILIPAVPPTSAPVPAPAANTKDLSLDSLLELNSLQDPHDPLATADTESGIDVLSPTKLDELITVDMDSLESSSDLPASSHSSPEPTKVTHTHGGAHTAQNNNTDDYRLADVGLMATRDDTDVSSLATAQPLLRISESSLTIASEPRSELSHMSQEVTRSSTPDSLTSLEAGAAPQDTAALMDADPPQDSAQDSALLESILLQNSTPLQTTEGSAPLLDSPLVPVTALDESLDQGAPQQSQGSFATQVIVPLLDIEASGGSSATLIDTTSGNSDTLIDMTPGSNGTLIDIDMAPGNTLLDAPVEQHTNEEAKNDSMVAGNLVTTNSDLSSLRSGEVTADPSAPTLPTTLTSPPIPTSSQVQNASTLDSSPQGALPPCGTNSVCGGDSSNAARDDCGGVVGVVGSGDGVDAAATTTTTTACSGSGGDGVGGGGGGVSGPVQSLQNGDIMEPQMEEDEDDFWGSKNDDDDFVPRRHPDLAYEEENDIEVKEEEEKGDEEPREMIMEEEEESNLLGSDDCDDEAYNAWKGAKGMKFKKRMTTTTTTTTTRTENGVGKVEKKEKKETVEETEKAKTKKIEESVEKKKIGLKEETAKKKTEKKEEEVKKEVEEKENGVAEEITEKKKKKKHRDTEDGERRKKKKKKRDSEKENKEATSSSANELSEEERPAPTPPLFNGHAVVTQDFLANNGHLILENEDTHSDSQPLISPEPSKREAFHSLLHAYQESSQSPAKESPVSHASALSDEEDLAGVSVKQLRVSYLSAAQDVTKSTVTHRTEIKPDIKADLNSSVKISSLVDTYSTPHRPVTPSSRPDDLTPVSLRSLKSAYEATATGANSSGSRPGSGGGGSPVGGSATPKEEVNVSLQQLREEYCRSVQDGQIHSHTPTRQTLNTGVSIRQLQVSQVSSECRQCGKQVFQMEKIVAEKAAWHKNCFRCKECNCILNLETYQSHEGVLYCKPHFKELFRPKVVVEDPDEARKERSTNKPDYGLEDLSSADLKQKFKMFEQIATEEERTPEPIPVRRSHSLLSKAARFMQGDDEYGIENSELGEYEDDEEEEEEEEDEEEEEGEEGEEGDGDKLKKKGRPTSFSGMKDLKAGFARKNRQEQLTKKRRQELAKFRQMLCAGKNISTREIFEGGNEDEQGRLQRKEQIKIEGRPDARNLRERFEKGLSITEDDEEDSPDKREVDRVFKEAETASKARNLFKQIDKTVAEGGEVVMRPHSSAQSRRENRLSRDGIEVEELELGRDPNLVKCTDNYEDAVDCRGTRKLLAKFRKMEMQADDSDGRGPRPPKQFTPPPEGESDYDSDEEYSDEEYSDEDEEDSEEESEEDSEGERKPKYKDEVLEMVKSSQSAKKAASLRAKFEKWESEVERNNEINQNNDRYEDEEECMPSIDTARNLRAMFENKAQEATRPANERPKVKVNRFV